MMKSGQLAHSVFDAQCTVYAWRTVLLEDEHSGQPAMLKKNNNLVSQKQCKNKIIKNCQNTANKQPETKALLPSR